MGVDLSIYFPGSKIREIEIKDDSLTPRVLVWFETGEYVGISATGDQLQQIAQAITTWSETQHLPASINAG